MFLGGGGCGKTHTILRVIKPLIESFFGRGGFEGQCPSNAGARLFGGRTIHSSIGLSATSSMKVEHLGLKGKTRTKVEKIAVPAAALAIDEVSQMSATMLHANALRHTYGRAREHGLQVDAYMKVNELFGRMPVVLLSGDYLQLPPVPESSSVLWPALGAAYAAVCHWCLNSEKATDLRMKGLFDCLQLCELQEVSCCKTMIGKL